jgi:TRAP-type C4-dicarboxylate transport system permease small subunit
MHRYVGSLARLCALAGGLVLSALILMTCLSVAGRALSGLGLGPVPGDFELVEAGIAFCVFAFLPLCQISSGHATVDILTSALPRQANRLLVAFWEVLMALAVALIAWRLFVGAGGKVANGEVTLLLQFPVWWAYAACLVPAAIGVITALWSAYDRLKSVATGRDSRPLFGEGGH